MSTKITRASDHRSSSSFQTYQSARGLSGDARDSTNHGCWSLVWLTTRSAITRMSRRCASLQQQLDVVDRAELLVDGQEVADVVAAVAEGRPVERQQPEAVHPEPLEVVEPLDEAGEVTHARRRCASRKPRIMTS